tara:strand:- start:5309 stop:6205 length:897 start_codon:yes stop_codon:yes gene_type:complete
VNLEFKIVNKKGLEPYINILNLLEQEIEYPLKNGKESFVINHGKKYYPFFTKQGYKTRFLIIKNKGAVIGSIVAVWKKVYISTRIYNGLYASDLKLKLEYRGKEIVKKCLWYLLLRWPFTKDFKGWDFIYFCAMQKNSKGVDKTFSGIHLGRLTSPIANFVIFMLDPKIFFNQGFEIIHKGIQQNINLSEKRKKDVLWNDGIKDIIYNKKQEIIRLGHLDPEILLTLNIKRFKNAINEIESQKNSLVCFAIDSRDSLKLNWLNQIGAKSETMCKLFYFSPFSLNLFKSNIIHISTGEI